MSWPCECAFRIHDGRHYQSNALSTFDRMKAVDAFTDPMFARTLTAKMRGTTSHMPKYFPVPTYDNSSSNSSRPKPAIMLLSALIMESASARLVRCSSRTFSSTVSRAISL
jgi:hypothetical protein